MRPFSVLMAKIYIEKMVEINCSTTVTKIEKYVVE